MHGEILKDEISCFQFTSKLFNHKMLLFNLDGMLSMEVCYVYMFLHMNEAFHMKKFGGEGGGGGIYNLLLFQRHQQVKM